MIYGYIYKIQSPSEKVYIGSTINIKKRTSYYKNLHCKNQPKVYASLMKYGWEAHTLEIIAIVEPEQRYKWEHILGNYYDVLGKKGLNCALPGYEETPAIVSEETKAKLVLLKLGKECKPETREKIRHSNLGKKQPIEAAAKSAFSRKGLKPTLEARMNMSIAQQKVNRINMKTTFTLGHKLPAESISKAALSRSKIILNIYTGVYYDSPKNAITSHHKKYNLWHFRQSLSGCRPNLTPFIYA